MNTAEYLVKKLEELGITDFFGLPGDYNFNIVYAIQDNPKTRWIGCTNELNAGYAADGYAREKGFGAIVTTYGVGELSAMNAIAGSFAENVPVISIVGAPSTKLLEDKAVIHHQYSNPEPYAFWEAHKSVTQASAFLNRDNAKIEIDRVLRAFVKERKPVYICIPDDIATMEISDRNADYSWMSDRNTLKELISKISDKIKSAKHPIILADVLTKRFNAVNELKKFAEKSGIPITNFVMGTGIIDTDYPKYLGTYLSEYGNPAAKKYLETTDCLIAVGTIYSDFNSFGFKLPYKINSQIAIYGTYTYVDGVRYDDIKMSDLLNGLAEVAENCEYEFEKTEWGYDRVQSKGDLTSDYIYPAVQEFLKENDIVISEIGLIPHGVYKCKIPNNTVVHSQALWCSIGWATPAAFGACIAKPDSRVVLITGEGAHQISAMEIGNMLRYGCKPVVIVVNNSGYTIERALSGKAENELNEIVNINYAKFARVFDGDIWSTKVETADDFEKALRVTGIMNKMCYIEACTDKMDMPYLSRQVFGKASLAKTVNNPQKEKKTKKAQKLAKEENVLFSTTVHESLIKED